MVMVSFESSTWMGNGTTPAPDWRLKLWPGHDPLDSGRERKSKVNSLITSEFFFAEEIPLRKIRGYSLILFQVIKGISRSRFFRTMEVSVLSTMR